MDGMKLWHVPILVVAIAWGAVERGVVKRLLPERYCKLPGCTERPLADGWCRYHNRTGGGQQL